MPPAQRGSAATAVFSVTTVVNPTNLAPTLPTHATNDLLLCFTCCRSATPTVATPAGWTSLANVTGTNGRLALFGIVATSASMTAPTVTWSGLTTGNSGTPCGAQCAAFTGMPDTTTGIVDVTGTVENGALSTTSSAAGTDITTSTAGDLVLSLTTRLDDAGTFTAPTGFTTVGSAGTTSGLDFAQAWALNVRAAAGSATVADWTLAGASSFASSGVLVALKAAAAWTVPLADTVTVTDDITVTVIAPTPYDAVIDADNPISHWKLGGTTTATDRKGVANLQAVNGPITTTTGIPLNNSDDAANTFTAASDQRFRLPTTTGIGTPYDTAQWSIECWFSVASFGAANTYITGRATATHALLIGATTNQRLRLQSAIAGGGATIHNGPAITAATSYHAVMTWDGTNFLRVYLNGTETNAFSGYTSSKTGPNEAPVIGNETPAGGTGSAFNGTIDEVAYYATALTPERILAHYNAGISAGGASLTATPTDTLTIGDAIALATGKTVALSEPVIITDAYAGIAAFDRIAADTLTVADVLAPAGAVARPLGDTLTIGDVAQQVSGKDIALSDPIAIAETNRRDATKPLADTLALVDQAAPAAALSRAIPDTLTLADQAVSLVILDRALADTLAVADQQAAAAAMFRALADTLTLADLASPLLGGGTSHQVPVNDALAVADDLTQAGATLRTVTDTLAIIDLLTPAVGGGLVHDLPLADAILITDLLVPVYTAAGAIRWLGVTVEDYPLTLALLAHVPLSAIMLDDEPVASALMRATKLTATRLNHWPLTNLTTRARRE